MFTPWLQSFALFSLTLSDINEDYFHFDERYSSLPLKGSLWNINVNIKIKCAKTCMADKLCLSVFVDRNTCYGYSIRMHDMVDTFNQGNMTYYEKKGLFGNVALGKPATLDRLYTSSLGTYTADRAVDGRRMPNVHSPYDSCAIIDMFSPVAWWKVDLEHNYPVTKIAILAREDNFPEQVANIAIGVGNSSSGPFSTCIETTGPDGWLGRFETFTCVSPVYGRFLMLSKVVGYQYMCLCEVEVYVSQ